MDWTTFTRKIRIKAKPEQVLAAWINCDIITKWFLSVCESLSGNYNSFIKGEKYAWEWHNYPNRSVIEILDLGSDYLRFDFGKGIIVSVEVSETEEGLTTLILKQSNIPYATDEEKENYHIGCRQAWSTWLLNLKSFLENGITLHDKSLGMREDLFDFVNT